jgi:two-component system sensor histidine kinase/response regulator
VTDHVGIVRDVTRRHAADALLRETQDNLNTVLDNMPAMVSSWTRDLRVRFMNKEHIAWYGIDPALHPNLHLRGVIGDAAFVELEPLVRRALGGERVSFERTIVSPDGRERWAQVHYIPDWRHGVVDGMIRLVFDITPLKHAQAALQANLQIHDAIFNEAGVGIALVRDQVFDRASRHLTELFGFDAGGLDGQRLSVICTDDSSYADLEADARAEMRSGRTFDREVSLRHRDGTPLWCRLVARAVDPDDPHRGSIVIVQDFRDRRSREVLLERARRAAESASRLKAEFLANMSHEIRTPMNGIIGMTRLTLESALTEAQRENLEIVLDSASSLLHLLNDILDFSKVEAGKLELERAEFDLRDRLWSAATPFATLARGKGLELVLDVAPDVPERLTGDSVRLMQVVTNLMSNAVKFTAAGSVTCRIDAQALDDGGCTLVVEVTDTGPGMSGEVQSRIFGSFVQADTTTTREHGGTGLGLAICTQIVHLMNGTIRVSSTPGAGSTFRFDARFEAASPPPEVPASQRERLAGASVLVVTALPALRASIARTLAAAGARTVLYAELGPAIAAAQLAQRVGAPFAGAIVDDAVAVAGTPDLPYAVHLRATDRPLDGPADTGLRKPARPADLLAAVCGQAPGGRTDAVPTPTPSRAARPLSILLAEDHPVNQKLAQRLLERRGHRVTWARHGEEAVRFSGDAAYDVILMDIQMPVMDGITAMRAIRAREAPRARRTPIVALTAHAMQGERERLLTLGMDDYLSKPLDAAALIRVVESFGARGGEGAGAPDDLAATLAEIGAAAAAEAAADPLADEGMAPVDLPVIDRTRALEGTQGDAGLLGELAALLRAELPAAGADVRAHVAAANWGGAARAAHRLKGAAGNLQALATQAAAARLEAACAAADEGFAKAAVESLDAELARLAAALDSLLAETA